MDNKEEDWISLARIFKVAFGKKILLTIIAFCVLVIGTLAIQFGLSNPKKMYVSTFEYDIPGLTNGKYIDGTKFDYRDLISVDSLNNIKESDSYYKSINIENMFNNNAISIFYDDSIDAQGNKSATYGMYTITVSKSYFKSESQARSFIKDIINTPYEKTEELYKTLKFTTNLESASAAMTYETKISFLQAQKDLIINGYNSLIEAYGDLQLTSTSLVDAASTTPKNISDKLQEVNRYFSDNDLTLMASEVSINGYLKNESYSTSQLTNEKSKLLLECDQNNTTIDALNVQIEKLLAAGSTAQSLEIASYNTTISSLISRNVEIVYQVKVINRKLGLDENNGLTSATTPTAYEATYSKEGQADFETRLAAFETALIDFTEVYKEVVTDVYSQNMFVYYYYNSVTKQVGGYSIVLIGAASLILGLITGCVVNLCLDHKKLHDEEPVKQEETTA